MTARGRVIALANAALWAAIIFGIAKSAVPLNALGWDLSVFRDASRLLLDGKPLYDFAAQANAHEQAFGRSFAVHYPYAYPPIFAIETIPFALTSQVTAFAIVTLVSIALLVWSARRVTARVEDALWVTASYPAVYGILAGQFVMVALAIFVATFVLLERARPIAAGLVASLLFFKPQMLLVLPIFFLIIPAARRALVGLAIGCAAQIALAFAVAPDAVRTFPGALFRMSEYVQTHFRASLGFTWRAFFTLIFPTHLALANAFALIAIVMCGAIAITLMRRSQRDLPRAFAIAILATLACAWHCAPYDWVILAIPAWILVSRLTPSAIEKRLLIIAFALPWTFVAIADSIAIHPAMPFLCAISFWLLRSRRDDQLGAV